MRRQDSIVGSSNRLEGLWGMCKQAHRKLREHSLHRALDAALPQRCLNILGTDGVFFTLSWERQGVVLFDLRHLWEAR